MAIRAKDPGDDRVGLLVVRAQSVDGRGRFSTGRYRLIVPAGLLLTSPPPDSPATAKPVPAAAPEPPRRRRPVPAVEQPDLFANSPDTTSDSDITPTQH